MKLHIEARGIVTKKIQTIFYCSQDNQTIIAGELIDHYSKSYLKNGCRIYVDIMTGEFFCQFRLQYPLAFIGRAVYPVGGDGMG